MRHVTTGNVNFKSYSIVHVKQPDLTSSNTEMKWLNLMKKGGEAKEHLLFKMSHWGCSCSSWDGSWNHLHHHFHLLNNTQFSIIDSFMVTSTWGEQSAPQCTVVICWLVVWPGSCICAGDFWESQGLGKGAAASSQSKYCYRPGWEQGRPGREETSWVWGNTPPYNDGW